MAKHYSSRHFLDKTRSAFLWTRILNVPFWAIFNMLSVILYKDLHATAFQITASIALKPLVALFSPYWSLSIHQRHDRLTSNLIWANVLKFFPFLGFIWFDNPWWFILSLGVYMLLLRGVIPAWMEIIKINVKGVEREKLFAMGSTLDYLGSAIIPLLFGWVLDIYHDAWRWIFFSAASIGIFSTLFLYRLPVAGKQPPALKTSPPESESWKEWIVKPWTQSWILLKERPDFARFQFGFMLGGSGLMIMHAALPMFFVDILQLSYTEILIALAVCKGIGYAAISPLWVKWFHRVNIYSFSSRVTLLAAIFPFILLLATYHPIWFYLAYVVYGIMVAGSDLSWNMSGPVFAPDTDSSVFSRTNVLTVGIRACVAPWLGSILYLLTNSVVVLLFGSLLCLLGTIYMRKASEQPQLGIKPVALPEAA